MHHRLEYCAEQYRLVPAFKVVIDVSQHSGWLAPRKIPRFQFPFHTEQLVPVTLISLSLRPGKCFDDEFAKYLDLSLTLWNYRPLKDANA